MKKLALKIWIILVALTALASSASAFSVFEVFAPFCDDSSRETPTEKTINAFDGGLSVQKYDASATSNLTPNNLTTESVRTDGIGGGVGGMVYSVRNGQLEASHSNHRGDVVARTDNRGTLSYFARYNAYGTRFHEVGNTYDRQRANTKDEEGSFNGLNEGERWRDLEHGVMFQPDPLGYYDGPNRYVYVQNNPITHYDARGLYVETLWDAANIGMGAVSFWNNAKAGNWKSAALDAGGLVVDVAATALPMVPAGAGAAIKAKRVAKLAGDAIDTTTDALKSADKVADGVKAAKNADKAKDAANAVENTEDAAKAANNATDAGQSVSQTQAKEGIYEFPDQKKSGQDYVGQSANLEKRLKNHEKTGRLKPGTEKRTEVPGGKTQREIAEHKKIQEKTGGKPASKSDAVSNKKDPIGPKRQDLLKEE